MVGLFCFLIYLIMDVIKLNDQVSFGIKQENKRLRLVVFEGGAELVCRKTSRTELVEFIRAETGHLFKGRLQLDNSGGYICVLVKGLQAGIVKTNQVAALLKLNQV